MIFDDVPKSVTEESSLENDKNMKSIPEKHSKFKGKNFLEGMNQMMDNSILNQNNDYCQSQKYDESMIQMNKIKDFNEMGLGLTDLRKTRFNKEIDNNINADQINFIGVSIDSQSFD